MYFDFKTNKTDGLTDINASHGIMTFRPYGVNTDFSGGLAHQLAFTDNGNMWLRSGSNATWLSLTKIYCDKKINLSDIDFNAKNMYANGTVYLRVKSILDSDGTSSCFQNNGNVSAMITSGGYFGIGTTNPDQKITVKGKIHAEEVIVNLNVPTDYVFQKYYTG